MLNFWNAKPNDFQWQCFIHPQLPTIIVSQTWNRLGVWLLKTTEWTHESVRSCIPPSLQFHILSAGFYMLSWKSICCSQLAVFCILACNTTCKYGHFTTLCTKCNTILIDYHHIQGQGYCAPSNNTACWSLFYPLCLEPPPWTLVRCSSLTTFKFHRKTHFWGKPLTPFLGPCSLK